MSIYISVDKRACDGALQVSIGTRDHGYRIAGPKYDGNGKNLLRHELTERDVEEIQSYLRMRASPAEGAASEK